jgi:hypothetical protein
MPIDLRKVREYLKDFAFKPLFIEALGWDRWSATLGSYAGLTLTPIAEKSGFAVIQCMAPDGNIPSSGVRAQIDKHLSAQYEEHIVIFVDGVQQSSLWRWVKKESGKRGKPKEHDYRRTQPGDSLIQRLAGIAFDFEDLDAEGRVAIGEVSRRVGEAFDTERVTKKFYDLFKKEHERFLKALTGLPDPKLREWYVSVLLNRLMFIYFIQRKGFLNSDFDYLRTKLGQMRAANRPYYRHFLRALFFDGLAKLETERSPEQNALLGKVPYLNGGLFLPHPIEDAHPEIDVPDATFEALFDFFDRYQWHLDDRPLRNDNEINPDVLGYIFEKYINQKEMGAYYTKEDITGYICRNTILPFLLERIDFQPRAHLQDIEPYIYEAVRSEELLPAETERERAARRQRLDDLKTAFANGQISTVNDLITYNLDIQAIVEDYLRGPDVTERIGPATPPKLADFYRALTSLTVLDPTCGSGAFLFAAINILAPLYNLCLDKMVRLTTAKGGEKYTAFRQELERVAQHPNRDYYVLKSIIVNNLYGVDIMEEAVEICKLRLFLKLASQVDDPDRVDPLPDIDFNIRAGNTLVGFATKDEIAGRLFAQNVLPRIEVLTNTLNDFRRAQLAEKTDPAVLKTMKANAKKVQAELADVLDEALRSDYGHGDLAAFRRSHKPFHWYAEFNGVMANGGFDVIVGNPPYVEYSTVRGAYTLQNYQTERCGNLYAYVMELCFKLQHTGSYMGMIVQLPIVCTDRMTPLQKLYQQLNQAIWYANFDDRPGKLFDGLEHIRATIAISKRTDDNQKQREVYSTRYNRWYSQQREQLFGLLNYFDVHKHLREGSIPKVGSLHSSALLDKLSKFRPLGVVNSGSTPIYYHNAPQYWIRAMDFVPYFWNERDGHITSGHIKTLLVKNASDAGVVTAVMNSSLFYWWFITFSNCRDLVLREIKSFPIDLATLSEDKKSALNRLAKALMQDYQRNAIRIKAYYKTTGRVEYDEFYPRLSKPIIDEIDRVLAEHYGFTPEELDFIINYDIKYRMGKDNADEA